VLSVRPASQANYLSEEMCDRFRNFEKEVDARGTDGTSLKINLKGNAVGVGGRSTRARGAAGPRPHEESAKESEDLDLPLTYASLAARQRACPALSACESDPPPPDGSCPTCVAADCDVVAGRFRAAAPRATSAAPPPPKPKRRPAARGKPPPHVRSAVEDDDDDVPIFACRARPAAPPPAACDPAPPSADGGGRGGLPPARGGAAPGAVSGHGKEGGGRPLADAPLCDPRAGGAAAGARPEAAQLGAAREPASESPGSSGSESGPVRRRRRRASGPTRKRVVRSASEPSEEEGPWDRNQRAVLAELRSDASPAVLCLADRVSGGGDVRFVREVCRALLGNRSTDELDLTVGGRAVELAL
jgi:hypothetical protein